MEQIALDLENVLKIDGCNMVTLASAFCGVSLSIDWASSKVCSLFLHCVDVPEYILRVSLDSDLNALIR